MTTKSKALIWAAIIISVALICTGWGVSTGVSMGFVTGLTGAAWASLSGDTACAKGCK